MKDYTIHIMDNAVIDEMPPMLGGPIKLKIIVQTAQAGEIELGSAVLDFNLAEEGDAVIVKDFSAHNTEGFSRLWKILICMAANFYCVLYIIVKPVAFAEDLTIYGFRREYNGDYILNLEECFDQFPDLQKAVSMNIIFDLPISRELMHSQQEQGGGIA